MLVEEHWTLEQAFATFLSQSIYRLVLLVTGNLCIYTYCQDGPHFKISCCLWVSSFDCLTIPNFFMSVTSVHRAKWSQPFNWTLTLLFFSHELCNAFDQHVAKHLIFTRSSFHQILNSMLHIAANLVEIRVTERYLRCMTNAKAVTEANGDRHTLLSLVIVCFIDWPVTGITNPLNWGTLVLSLFLCGNIRNVFAEVLILRKMWSHCCSTVKTCPEQSNLQRQIPSFLFFFVLSFHVSVWFYFLFFSDHEERISTMFMYYLSTVFTPWFLW